MATTERGRSFINVKRLVMWGLLTDDEAAVTYDTDAYAFTTSLMAVKYSPRVETAEQYGDGIRVEDYVAKDGGDIELSITGFKQGDGVYLFGETVTKDGTEVSSAADIVPYKCVAFMTERSDGKVNLYKFPKTKFMPQGEDINQREGTKIAFGTANIKGTYSPLISSGNDCYKRLGIDPETDAEFINDWFATADFYTAGDGT